MNKRFIVLLLLGLLPVTGSAIAEADMQPMGRFAIDRTEVSVAAFRRFVTATGMITMAERQGGGSVCELRWVRKPGWVWSAPLGKAVYEKEAVAEGGISEAAIR